MSLEPGRADHRLRLVFSLLLPVLPGLLAVVFYYHLTTPVLDCWLTNSTETTIARLTAGGLAERAGLRVGDTILAIDGQPPAAWQAERVGQLHQVEAERQGRRFTVWVAAVPLLQQTWRYFGVALVVLLAFWGVGAGLFFRRYHQREVRIFYVLAQVIALALVAPLTSPWSVLPWLALISNSFTYLAGPLLFHYAISFPAWLGTPSQRRLGLGLAYGLVLTALLRVWQISYLYLLLIITLALGVMVYSYFRRASPHNRRRLRLVVLGSALAGAPTLLGYMFPLYLGLPYRLPPWLIGVALVIAPISYLYAAARDNLFGIDRLLNRALVVAILSLGVLLLSVVPLVALYTWWPTDLPLQTAFIASLALLVGLNFHWLRGLVQRGVDRLFYGGWYDYPGVVEALSDELARCLDRLQLHWALTGRVPALMQLKGGALWIGEPGAQPPPLPEAAAWFGLTFQGQPRAVWWLGARREGDELSEADRRILKTLARQAETALGNVLRVEALRQQLAEIRASRETLAQTQRQLLRSREAERARLARELHDGPVQALVALNMQLGLAQPALSQVNAGLATTLAEMRAEVQTLLADLRQVCVELRPPMLDTLGLGAALRALAEEWSAQNQLPLQLALPPEASLQALPAEVGVNLYRVAQEALANVARHARAQRVTLRLAWEAKCLALTVQDDGQGFVLPAALPDLLAEGHFGLLGLRERMEVIGGQLTVATVPGQGTTIQVQWPGPAGLTPEQG